MFNPGDVPGIFFMVNNDEIYMKSALKLASGASNRVSTNPKVGCIIVRNKKIAGRGYHEYFGGPHAEVIALSGAGRLSRGATMYVTLEPCCHYGKTPPCTDAIVKAGIKEVVMAMKDPNVLVMGKSIRLLRRRGVRIRTGVMEKEARKLNEAYIKYTESKMPFIILKSAMTLDGKITTVSGNSKWITNLSSRQYAHRLRGRVDAILVGINTVLADNPRLTSRKKGTSPIRVILDTHLKIPLNARVLNEDAPAIVATASDKKRKIKQLQEKGVEVINPGSGKDGLNLKKLMKMLGKRSISSIVVEGGGSVNASFLNQGLVDRVLFFIAPKILGGRDSLTPVEGSGIRGIDRAIGLKDITIKRFGDDILVDGYVV